MIQITGLTKVYRKGAPPAVLDLTFDARPGTVTALLGAEGAGKSTALRLMLELERGQGVTLFDGRRYRRLRHPEREVGVLLPGTGEAAVAGHPGRKARSHLRMLAAAVGVPARRADELLEQTRLAAVAGQRLRTFSPGMHRRLALAAALLGDPGALLLDGPADGLSPRNVEWFHSFLRSFGAAGGTVLVTTRTPQEASQLADRVVTLDRGRLVADQPVAEFRRTRLSPEVAVRGPQMARLADLLVSQGADVRRDGSVGLAVAGIDRTEIGELAYRHGILLHELADRVVEQPAPRVVLPAGSGRSGHLRLHPEPGAGPSPEPAEQPNPEPDPAPNPEPKSEPGPQSAAERIPEPAAEPTPVRAVTTPAEPATVSAPEASVPEATAPEATASVPRAATAPKRNAPRRREDGSLPAVAIAAALPAAALPVLGSAGRRPGPVGRRPEPTAEAGSDAPAKPAPAPIVAVDRLFRDDPAPALPQPSARVRPPGRRVSADDLLTDDTVRLRRPVSGTSVVRVSTAQPPAAPTAPAVPAAPAPATPDDHRSE
ncbi:ATP-binding cassette domain-containing protein [Kitasatospora xanthocidica]|uniref:ATP-binding cassette domain-containing protein n=1 Tax=Kitasatospora xanthocidica TaxID=83382 RepID=A0A373A1W6_9ACTN|nr:ATP-binding cassette domain-containing protein [Kitasatospora xanthocidica]RGD61620.1 ATP-binding cassette domain-containing protein [Kitasatospora xanthocidica]